MDFSEAPTLENVPLGIHFFKASDFLQPYISFNSNFNIDLQKDLKEKETVPEENYACYGSVIYEVKLGVNYLTIPVHCDLLDIVE